MLYMNGIFTLFHHMACRVCKKSFLAQAQIPRYEIALKNLAMCILPISQFQKNGITPMELQHSFLCPLSEIPLCFLWFQAHAFKNAHPINALDLS